MRNPKVQGKFVSIVYDKKDIEWIKFISFQSASNRLKLELKSLSAKKSVNFNSHLKTFYKEFCVEFYIKIKPIESKIIYLLYIYFLEIDSPVFKSVQVSFFFPVLYKNNYRVTMANMTLATRGCVQCWRNYEYLMLLKIYNVETMFGKYRGWARGCCMHVFLGYAWRVDEFKRSKQ